MMRRGYDASMGRIGPCVLALTIVTFMVAFASREVAGQEHHHPAPGPSPSPEPSPSPSAQMPMGPEMPMQHAAHGGHEMHGMLGPYAMERESSGTSWQPDSALMEGIHLMRGPWMLMIHGFASLVFDHQGGLRGDDKVFGPTMGMLMAQRPAGGGTFGARAMLSVDPGTVGKTGYPLLLQTGEAADGRPLIDRQHPHDMFMELAATYSHPIGGDRGSLFLYAAIPGEPALGPPTFMHRFSGMEIPEAPISHHWMDSTHITFGVLTGGVTWRGLKVDASAFRGREPDEHRWNIESPSLDSYSARLQYNPTASWSLQASAGHLHSPEELEPDVDLWRSSASVTYDRPRPHGAWQTTLAWGRNDKTDQEPQDAFLVESTLRAGRHTVFARVEHVAKDELFTDEPLSHEIFEVQRLTAGYLFDLLRASHLAGGIGGLVSFIGIPESLSAAYDGQPVSYMVFVRAQIR